MHENPHLHFNIFVFSFLTGALMQIQQAVLVACSSWKFQFVQDNAVSPHSHSIYYLCLYRKCICKTISANYGNRTITIIAVQISLIFLSCFCPLLFPYSTLFHIHSGTAEGRRGPQSQSLTCDCFLGFPPVKINKNEKSDFCNDRALPKLPLAKQPWSISVLRLRALAESYAKVTPGANSPLSLAKHTFPPHLFSSFFPMPIVPPSLMGYFPYSPKPIS